MAGKKYNVVGFPKEFLVFSLVLNPCFVAENLSFVLSLQHEALSKYC